MQKKVFLDTNVVLSSIDVKSYSYLLKTVTNNYVFYISKIVEEEIDKKIRDSKSCRSVKHDMRLKVKLFLIDIKAIVLDDTIYERKFKDKNENDSILCEIACANSCDILCTYNYKDFINCSIELVTPCVLLKKSSLDPNDILQIYFNMIKKVTGNFALYIGFNIQGIIQDIEIFKDLESGYKLILSKENKILLYKNDKFVKKSNTILKLNHQIKLYILKYNTNINIYDLSDKLEPLLVNSVSKLELSNENIFPLNLNNSFYGHIREVSMYLLNNTNNEKLMSKKTLKNITSMDSIEYLWGNITI